VEESCREWKWWISGIALFLPKEAQGRELATQE
jgi:hypothetical protein